MLAGETERRAAVIADTLERAAGDPGLDPGLIESLRAEAHGLKGAAQVVGQESLAQLAALIEARLASHPDTKIDAELRSAIRVATEALQAGARAAAQGAPEPPEIAASIESLSK